MLAWGKPNCGDADPELFFSEYIEDVTAAKAYCVGCPIIDACKEEAISGELVGVWGGTTEAERGKIRYSRIYYKSRAKEEAKARRDARPKKSRPVTAETLEKFKEYNTGKAVKASLEMEAELRRAIELFGSEIPQEIMETLIKRIAYPELSLIELGQKLNRKVTKDVVAGRLRRVRQQLKRREESNEYSPF